MICWGGLIGWVAVQGKHKKKKKKTTTARILDFGVPFFPFAGAEGARRKILSLFFFFFFFAEDVTWLSKETLF